MSTSDIFFSIILCTYNRAHLLSRAIHSVLKQTYPNWELVIVDDGSTDNSIELIEDYCNQDSRIRLLKKNHSGIADSRNQGVEASQFHYITFLDSDDEYKTNHLELHNAFIQKNLDIDLFYGSFEVIGNPYVPDVYDHSRKIHVNECVLPGTFFIKKNVIKEVGGFPLVSFGEDRRLFDAILSKNYKNKKTNFSSYIYYRDEPDSLCNQLLKSKGNL